MERESGEVGRQRGRPKKRLLTVAELRAYLNISRSTLYVLMDEGLPYLTVGHFRRFDLTAVLHWIEGRQEQRRREDRA